MALPHVLVTGGAGYIGSHATRQLLDAGHPVTVIDDLSHGHRAAVDRRARFFPVSIADRAAVEAILREARIDAVMHFAGSIEVGESVVDPSAYYRNNLVAGLTLLDAMRACEVRRIVFSSTAATYGNPVKTPIEEDQTLAPVNPYGRTKYFFEQALADYSAAYGLGYVALRYFNVAGASSDLSLGEAHEPETHLIPRVLAVAAGKQPFAAIFGTDYPTPDGTCIRDFVHVEDLVAAHLLALGKAAPGVGRAYNLGSEQGFSVRQVIDVCRRVTGRPIEVREHPRRPGDPAILVASSARIRRELGWSPRHPQLEAIVGSAWKWHESHPNGFGG
jgi:UDP-glucose-4-epimerase GalE